MTLASVQLTAWRKGARLTMDQLGAVLDVDVSTVCRWEKGERCPDVLMAQRIERYSRKAVPVGSWGIAYVPQPAPPSPPGKRDPMAPTIREMRAVEAPWSTEAGEPTSAACESQAHENAGAGEDSEGGK